jgi:hypothetical protein
MPYIFIAKPKIKMLRRYTGKGNREELRYNAVVHWLLAHLLMIEHGV